MKRWLAVLILTLTAAPAAFADSGVSQASGAVTWPDTGVFTNALVILPSGQPACILGFAAQSPDPAVKLNVMVWLQKASAHLYVVVHSNPPPSPSQIVFSDGGEVFARLPVIDRTLPQPGAVNLVGDLTDEALAGRFAQHFASGHRLTLSFEGGGPTGTIATEGFAQARAYRAECFQRASQILAAPAAPPPGAR